jgi:hypothetical protein
MIFSANGCRREAQGGLCRVHDDPNDLCYAISCCVATMRGDEHDAAASDRYQY